MDDHHVARPYAEAVEVGAQRRHGGRPVDGVDRVAFAHFLIMADATVMPL
jgi:hypothetical protein